MEPFLLRIYLSEINLQCNYALHAVNELNVALQQGNITELFHTIHSFLIHASNVSKLLWPPKERDKAKWERAKNRANTLRDILNLPEEHRLKDRKLRNHLEHYDARLDDWVYNSTHHNYIDMNVGPKNFIGETLFKIAILCVILTLPQTSSSSVVKSLTFNPLLQQSRRLQ